MSINRRSAIAAGAACLTGAAWRPAAATAIDRPARIVLGFPGGSIMDVVARLYAEQLRGSYAPQVIVESRVGAGGRIAIDAVKNAAPDGSTILLTHESSLTVYPLIYPRTLGYDPLVDFVPVSPISSFAFGFFVSARHPARDFAGFVDWARAQPEVTYATPAAGSTPHFLTTQMGKALGLNLVHVPYRDTSMIPADVEQGRVTAVMNVLSVYAEHHVAGRLRMLATTGPRRVSRVPEASTFAELGLPQLTQEEWYAMLLPARTPPAMVTALNRAITAASTSAGLRQMLERIDQTPFAEDPEALAIRIRQGRERWAPIVRETGYTAE